MQTVWRSKYDSNSQYLFEFVSPDVSVSCRLQKTAREFHFKLDIRSVQSGPVSIRRSFEPQRRTPSDLWQKVVTLRGPRQPDGVRM
jgi:hypothetical protein